MTGQCSIPIDDLPNPEDNQPLDRNRVVDWFSRWRRPIGSWLRRKGVVQSADVDDVAQEVFLRLLRYIEAKVVQNPQGYLFRIATNVVNEWRSRSSARQPHDKCWLEELTVEEHEEPESSLARMHSNEHARAVLSRLPQRQRELLLLHVSDGLTYKQISQKRGLTLRSVRRDLTRAYARLRDQLETENSWDGTITAIPRKPGRLLKRSGQ